MVALLAYSTPNTQQYQSGAPVKQTGGFSQHNLAIHHNTTEFSVAYFGFDNIETMETFIRKYDNFIVDDTKHKYLLQVSKAIHQSMPVLSNPTHSAEVNSGMNIEETEDYLHFVNCVLNNPVERLLPL
jgi:Smg-4/UPF3 family